MKSACPFLPRGPWPVPVFLSHCRQRNGGRSAPPTLTLPLAPTHPDALQITHSSLEENLPGRIFWDNSFLRQVRPAIRMQKGVTPSMKLHKAACLWQGWGLEMPSLAQIGGGHRQPRGRAKGLQGAKAPLFPAAARTTFQAKGVWLVSLWWARFSRCGVSQPAQTLLGCPLVPGPMCPPQHAFTLWHGLGCVQGTLAQWHMRKASSTPPDCSETSLLARAFVLPLPECS